MDKIESPKVFISYAWGTKEHDEKVLAFASKLMEDGVEVILDKWSMKEGNDTFSFMERSVTDKELTNVLILLDPLYAKKADAHEGGVGTETQIISAKVYKEVDQDKFIPIIFERDENGEVCKPTYLQGRLHFDLTIEEKYDEEYHRLVKSLYGEETYVKPQLGKRPAWVDKPIAYSPKRTIRYEELKQNKDATIKSSLLRSYLDQISERVLSFSKENEQNVTNEDIVRQYDVTQEIRDDYLFLLKHAIYVDNHEDDITCFFEETTNNMRNQNNLHGILAKIFLHEIFIYTIAWLWKNKEFKALGFVFGKTYLESGYTGHDNGATSYHMFYSGSDHDILDKAVCAIDNKQYYSGVAAHWMANIATDFCSKEYFVFADLLCYNYSVYGKDYIGYWRWFPITYCYNDRYNSILTQEAKRLMSRRHVISILPIFGYESVEDFSHKFNEVHDESQFREYRYPTTIEPASVLGFFITADKIGTLP